MDKKELINLRHKALKELIKSHQIEDQETLVQLMQEKYGIETNQAVISRDLRNIGAIKIKSGDKIIYDLPEVDASKEILRLAIKDIVHNETLIIIRTLAGTADFVADFLDAHREEGILATIAGENTIFVTPNSIKNIKKVFSNICNILYFKQKDI